MRCTGVVVTVAVDDVGVETVLIGIILDGPDVTAGFLQGVLSYNFVAVPRFLLPV
jgi:hypothetical protein